MSKKLANEKKQPNVIQASGLQDAYEYLLRQLCKKGLPTGNVYEFAAQTILSYEKKLKNTNIQVKAQQAAKEAHEKYVKKVQDKEQKNLEEVSRYELAFREEQKRKEIYNQSLSQEPVQRSSAGRSVIEQRNQSVDNDQKSPPKTQKKQQDKQSSPVKQEIKEKKEEQNNSMQQQAQAQNQQQAQAQNQQQQPQKDKKGAAKKDNKKYESSILKDLKIEEQKDQSKNQEQVQDQKQVQQQPQQPQQQQQAQAKAIDQSKDNAKEPQKEQTKEQPKQEATKQDNKKTGKKK